MDYIVFDLELNSKIFKSRLPNEIIEIGAVKLNDRLERVSSFQSFVKPKVHSKLFSIVKRKTNILQQDINNAQGFKDVLSSFKEWIGRDFILCSWGHDDIHHLKLNCQFNRSGSKWVSSYIDIQKHLSKIYNAPAGQRYSLTKALEILGIEVEGELHRADIDAKYTAEVFKRIFDRIHD